MRCKFIQTKSKIAAQYECLNEDEVLYTAEIPLNFRGAKAQLFRNSEVLYTIKSDKINYSEEWRKEKLPKRRLPYNIYDANNNLVGSICRLKNTKFFNGYIYYELILNDTKYLMYEIGLGKEGIKLPIYRDDTQVALIEKDSVVYDNKDTYEIIAIDEMSLEVSALFNLYYDFVKHGNYGEINYKSKETYYLYTMNKELKNKYDSTFKMKYI